MLSAREVPIADHFDHPTGTLVGYDCYDAAQRAQLRKQQHIDIRCFMSQSANYWQENWTFSAAGSLFNGTDSVLLNLPTAPTGNIATSISNRPVDIASVGDDWKLTLDAPSWDDAVIDHAASYIELTAAAGGSFSIGPTVKLFLNTASYPQGSAAVNQIIEWPISVLAPLSGTITGVRIGMFGTASTFFKFAAIRLLSPDWMGAPLDINTLFRAMMNPVPKSGLVLGSSYPFPQSSIIDPLVPTNFPILFRSDGRAGADDPKPIDVSEAILFSPGRMNSPGEIRVYMREGSFDNEIMLDLNGVTMAELDAAGAQPDYGVAKYSAKTQRDLEGLAQSLLDDQFQWALDAKPDLFTAAWIQSTLVWDAAHLANVEVRDTDGNVYPFPQFTLPPLNGTDDTRYILTVELEEESIRVRVLSSDTERLEDAATLFDSTVLTDGSVLRRRSGRVGVYANFVDGDAFIQDIIPYSVNFAEYRSQPLRSISPVSGAQVFFGGSATRELFTGYVGENADVIAAPDRGDNAFAIKPTTALGRVRSNFFSTHSLRHTRVSVDVFIPSAAAEAGAELAVTYERLRHFSSVAHSTPLNVGRVPVDRWHTLEFDLSEIASVLPGNNIVALSTGSDAVFYVANFSISHVPLEWSARATPLDPWGDNTADWLPLRDVTNSQTGGVLFDQPGFELRARCIANRQDASLTSVKIIPQYAQPGRLVWTDIGDPVGTTYTFDVDFTIDTDDLAAIVTAVKGLGGSALLANVSLVEWDWGDGAIDYGLQASHTYAIPSTYTIAMTVHFYHGDRMVVTKTV
ncbi:hypothetical protein [Candidatus Solirubrobacter pratensis]|uniref:hypothetical protein n=1 Tax=Candidatus Solirubrobacter pratensis TaxID=1298857 RepID=UPI0004110B9A|nr:hypothetical protein [Candidatus Solirubrobacter pratensis]